MLRADALTELVFPVGSPGEGYMTERLIGSQLRLWHRGKRDNKPFCCIGAFVGISIAGGVVQDWCDESVWVACLGRKKLVIEAWGKLVLLDLNLKSIVLRVVDGFPYAGFCFSEVSNFF